ncbi:MAG TPA: hypothetical protein VFU86_02150 [Terriglobales bacterium]|nr:hypothetical protein [Terriglobales bacterium]
MRSASSPRRRAAIAVGRLDPNLVTSAAALIHPGNVLHPLVYYDCGK